MSHHGSVFERVIRKKQERKIAFDFEDTAGNHLLFGAHVVIKCLDRLGSPGFPASGVSLSFRFFWGFYGTPDRKVLGRGF